MAVARRIDNGDTGFTVNPRFTPVAPITVDDRVVVQIACATSGGPMVSIPSGWSLIDVRSDSNVTRWLYEKIMVSGDINALQTWTLTASMRWTISWFAMSGVDPTYVTKMSVITEGTTNTNTHLNPAESHGVNSMGVTFIAERATGGGAEIAPAYTVPSTWTKGTEVITGGAGTPSGGTGAPVASCVAYKTFSGAGSSGGGVSAWVGNAASADVIVTNLSYESQTGGVVTATIARTGFSSNGSNAIHMNVTLPSGIMTGDTILLAVTTALPSAFPMTTPPTGWSLLSGASGTDGNASLYFYTKTAAGTLGQISTDSGAAVTWDFAVAAKYAVEVASYTNVTVGTPVVTTHTAGSSTSQPSGSVTPSTGGWALQAAAERTTSGTNNTGWTAPTDGTGTFTLLGAAFATGASPSASMAMADTNGITSGATGGGNYITDIPTTDSVVITLPLNPTSTNIAPVANPGPAIVANSFDTVTADGTGSSDPNGDPVTYLWSLDSKSPAGAPAITFSSTTASKPTLYLPGYIDDVTYTIGLIVNDGTTNSAKVQTTIFMYRNTVQMVVGGVFKPLAPKTVDGGILT